MASNIGIKIANGEFYSLVEENSLVKKRLVLTTVHDNQPSMQIDLYRSADNTMSDAQYIGSVVVENIKPRAKGDPSIEMVVSSNENGEIIADAIDLDTGVSGEHYILTVSLKSLDETSREMEIPDFELESNEEPPTGLYNHAEKVRKEKKRKLLIWPFIILIALLLLGLAAWYIFFSGKVDRSNWSNRISQTLQTWQAKAVPEPARQETAQPEPVRQEPKPTAEPAQQEPVRQEPVQTAEPVQQEPARQEPVQTTEPALVIRAPETPPAPRTQPASQRPPPPVASYNVPATIPRGGVNYTIRYGDTLWDISEAFYRDPWHYTRIARYNNIRNPNYIISGRTIRIPPKN